MNRFQVLRRPKYLLTPFLALVLVCSFLALFSGSAWAAGGPTFSQIYPANGAAVKQTNVVVSLVAQDPDFVDAATLVMKVDGVAVRPISQYNPIDESTEDYTTFNIYYPATFTIGAHSASVSIKDNLGNLSSYSWSFTVGQPPKILSFSPPNGANAVDRTPTITAEVASGASIVPTSIVMTLNNAPVPAVYDAKYGTISYTPTSPLANETFYNVALSLKDTAGNQVSGTWQFYINTFQEMTYTVDDATCQRCHDRTKHPVSNCGKCHGINSVPNKPTYPIDDCYGCHFNAPNPAVYHTNGLPVSNPPNHPVQTTGSCLECHDKTWVSMSNPSTHNIFSVAVDHTTSTTGCTECHATSLTREHLRRNDADGTSLTCFTCHNSPDPNVKNAIATNNSACAACHGGTGHPEHNNGLDDACQTCHGTTVLNEPQFHANSDCSICHENTTNPLVAYNISVQNTNCIACHNQGHNVQFIEPVAADIPLYAGFAWSQPQAVGPWAGETWFPAEFDTVGAKMMFSNHRQDVSGTALFTWYTQQLEANGWQKLSGPNEGSSNFTLAYQKGVRRLNVNVYTGASHDPAAAYVGEKIELIWK